MALIKCPECGHEVSDKAPFCPHCGVEIANNESIKANTAEPKSKNNENTPEQKGGKNKAVYVLSFVVAIIICAGVGYFYLNAQTQKEQQEFEYAAASGSAEAMQSYLDTFRNAPIEHRDSITHMLEIINQEKTEWANVVATGSRSALVNYMEKHPETAHMTEIKHKLDSMDWKSAVAAGSIAALKSYMEAHPDGENIDEANEMIRSLNINNVQPEEQIMIGSLFRHFFQSINSRDEEGATSCVSPLMSLFLGKKDATRSDIITYINKLYKDDVHNLNWYLNDDYDITKKEVGENMYEYGVNFTGKLKTDRTNESTTQLYRIIAKVSPEGLITELSMKKTVE